VFLFIYKGGYLHCNLLLDIIGDRSIFIKFKIKYSIFFLDSERCVVCIDLVMHDVCFFFGLIYKFVSVVYTISS